MTPKYTLGQIIKHKNDPDGDFGVISEIHVTNQGVTYTITFDDFDRNTRQVVPAVKHVLEEDAVLKDEPKGEENEA